MEDGDYVTSINSDKKLKQIIRQNGFIHKLTMKNYSHRRYKNMLLSKTSNTYNTPTIF